MKSWQLHQRLIYNLNGAIRHEGGQGYADILRDNVPAVNETARRIFHRQRKLKDRHDDLRHKQLLMRG